MEFLITAILGSIIIFCLYWLATLNLNFWEKHGFPHVKSLPFFGNSLDLLLKSKSLNEVLDEIYYKLDGERCIGFFQFLTPALLVRDPELINQILITDFSYFYDQAAVIDKKIDPLSSHLLNLSGDLWKITRRRLLPSFTSSKMKNSMFGQIKSLSEEAVLYLKDNVNKELDIKDVMFKLSLNIKGNIAYGINANAFSNGRAGSNEFLSVCKLFFAPSQMVSIKFLIAVTFPYLQRLLRYKIINRNVESFFKQLVKDTVKYREETGIRRNDFLQLMIDTEKQEKENMKNLDKKLNQIDKNDLEEDYKYLLSMQKGLEKEASAITPSRVITEDCIVSHTFIFISAGSDATATILSFALYELAINKNVQKRLQNEIDSHLLNNFNYETLKNLKYLDNVLNEVLRKHGSGTPLVRKCSMDYQIPETKMIIKKGTLIYIPLHTIQNDPKYFQNPEKFDPDRFDESITKGTFLPFGNGPRICLAMRLSILEMKIVLSTLLFHFNVKLSDKTKTPLKIEKTSIFRYVKGGL